MRERTNNSIIIWWFSIVKFDFPQKNIEIFWGPGEYDTSKGNRIGERQKRAKVNKGSVFHIHDLDLEYSYMIQFGQIPNSKFQIPNSKFQIHKYSQIFTISENVQKTVNNQVSCYNALIL